MSWGAVIGAGAAILGGSMASNSARSAARSQRRGANDAIAYQRESRDLALAYNKPYRDASYRATAAMMDMVGLSRGGTSRGASGGLTRAPYTQPRPFEGGSVGLDAGKGGGRGMGRLFDNATGNQIDDGSGADVPDLGDFDKYSFKTDPGYQFRMDEGMKALERGAAARGGLLSGGFARKALRYSQDYASNEYMNVFNRIATIAGFGQVSTANSTGAIMGSAANTGNAMMAAGDARASGYIGQGNAWANAINEISQIDWGSVFNGNSGNGRSPA